MKRARECMRLTTLHGIRAVLRRSATECDYPVPSLSMSLCLRVSLCVSLSFSVSASLSVHISVSVSISIPVSVSVCVSVSLSVSVHISVSVSISISVFVFVSVSPPCQRSGPNQNGPNTRPPSSLRSGADPKPSPPGCPPPVLNFRAISTAWCPLCLSACHLPTRPPLCLAWHEGGTVGLSASYLQNPLQQPVISGFPGLSSGPSLRSPSPMR